MSFSYINNNIVEFYPEENVIIKMAVLEGDDDLAKIWFVDSEDMQIGRGEYVLQINNQQAPYVGDNYIVQHRKNYTMNGPNGFVFSLNYQKQQHLKVNGKVNYNVKDHAGNVVPRKPKA